MRTTYSGSVVLAGTVAGFLPGLAAASAVGFLGNFDVINDTGSTAHGFEIELEGLSSSDITDTFGGPGRGFPTGRGFDPATSVQRYGSPVITEYSAGGTFGTRITYFGIWDGSSWDYGTPSGTFITPGDNCWSGGGVGYGPDTPCDHFGVGTSRNPTKTTYNWLLETGQPGMLSNGLVTLPAPVWNVIDPPPPAPGADPGPPIVEAVIQAPAPEVEAQFGAAIWVKVFTTELEDPIELEDLVGDSDEVQQAVTEIEWQLLQRDPGNPDSGKLESGYGVPVGPNAASILRRYEFFEYAGAYKPEDNEADPLFGDSNPDPGEIGTYLGSQNAAANLAPVPVPGGIWLLGSALAGLGGVVRRSRTRRS
jgi:hypothetical protein